MTFEVMEKFKRKAVALAKAKRTRKYMHVVGKLKTARLLDAPDIPEYRGPVDIKDVLWAGTIEPRVLEVLPALLVSRPKYLRVYKLPEDLKRIVDGIQAGNPHEEFRGIPANDYKKWVPNEYDGAPRLKTFRFYPRELEKIKKLRVALGLRSDVEVLRRGLNLLERETR